MQKIWSINHRWILLAIAIGLLFAYYPVLVNTYIRQDDMAWQLWKGMLPSERYDYANVLVNLFRPVSWPIILFTDEIAYTTENAVYVRMINVAVLIVIGYLIYGWQLKFTKERLLSAFVVISILTLPPYQVFAATANYLLMIVGLFLTISGTWLIWDGWAENRIKYRLYVGYLLVMMSLMDYPLASMFVWPMLLVAVLYSLSFNPESLTKLFKQKFMVVAVLSVSAQGLYFLLGKVTQHLVGPYQGYGSSLSIGFDGFSELRFLALTAFWHSHFWFWFNADVPSLKDWIVVMPLVAIVSLYLMAMYRTFHSSTIALVSLGLVSVGFVLCYLPVILSSIYNLNYRYAIVTMPYLLIILIWSLYVLLKRHLPQVLLNAIMLFLAIFFVILSHTFIENYIVKPQVNDLNYIASEVNQRVVPLIKNGKKVAVVMRCYAGPAQVYEYNAAGFEYGMRIWQYTGQCISSIVHVLRSAGIETTISHRNNDTFLSYGEIADVPWGLIMALSDSFSDKQLLEVIRKHTTFPVVIIDKQGS